MRKDPAMADRALALVVGATRGIGLGVVKEFLTRGWDVIATARQPATAAALSELSRSHPGRVEIATLDMNDAEGLDSFADVLKGRTLDAVLINAGISGPAHQ